MALSKLLQFFRRANSRKGDIVRALATDSKRSFWALLDQGVVSLGNFGVMFVLGAYFNRIHDLSDYGKFIGLLELIIFLNGVQGALVVYPLIVRGAIADAATLGRMTGMSLFMTFLGSPICILSVIIATWIAGASWEICAWAIVAMLLWQLQETCRRALMSQLRFREALIGDSISYLGQLAAIVVLARFNQLTVESTFQSMALTSGVATLLQAAQIGLHQINRSELRGYSRECWSLGRWVLMGNLSNLLTGPAFTWNFLYWWPSALVGINGVLTNLLRLTNPLCFGIASVVMPHAAKARQERGIHGAKRELYRFGLLGAVLLLPYLAIIVIAPGLVIRLVYKTNVADLLPYTLALQISAIGSALIYAATITGAFLNAMERSRKTFISQLMVAGAMLVFTLPLMAMFNVIGAAIGMLIVAVVQTAAHFYFINEIKDGNAESVQPSAPPVAKDNVKQGACAA